MHSIGCRTVDEIRLRLKVVWSEACIHRDTYIFMYIYTCRQNSNLRYTYKYILTFVSTLPVDSVINTSTDRVHQYNRCFIHISLGIPLGMRLHCYNKVPLGQASSQSTHSNRSHRRRRRPFHALELYMADVKRQTALVCYANNIDNNNNNENNNKRQTNRRRMGREQTSVRFVVTNDNM